MSKLRHKRPEKRAHGAFREREHERPELDERDAQRAHIIEAVSSVWSYEEIREFAEKQDRERERAFEIAEMFAEAQDLSGASGSHAQMIEDACFAIWQAQRGSQREDRRLNHAARAQASAKKRARFRARYQSDPEFRATCIARTRDRYELVKGDPVLWRRMLRVSREWRRKHPEKVRLYWRKWRDNVRRTDPEKWERICERVRARDRKRPRNTPERRQSERVYRGRRRAAREPYRGRLDPDRIVEAYEAGCSVEEIQAAARVDVYRVLREIRALTRRRKKRTDEELASARAFLDSLPHGQPVRTTGRKLSPEDVLEIRESKQSTTALARAYGVSRNTIYQALTGENWPHVGGPIRAGQRRLSEMERRSIRIAHAGGATATELAAKHRVSRAAIRYLVREQKRSA